LVSSLYSEKDPEDFHDDLSDRDDDANGFTGDPNTGRFSRYFQSTVPVSSLSPHSTPLGSESSTPRPNPLNLNVPSPFARCSAGSTSGSHRPSSNGTFRPLFPLASSLGDSDSDEIPFMVYDHLTGTLDFIPGMENSYGEGFCYLALFPPEARPEYLHTLGLDPSPQRVHCALVGFYGIRNGLKVCVRGSVDHSTGAVHIHPNGHFVDLASLVDSKYHVGRRFRTVSTCARFPGRSYAASNRHSLKWTRLEDRDGYCWIRALPSRLLPSERLRLIKQTGANPPSSYLRFLFDCHGFQPHGVLTTSSTSHHVIRASQRLTFLDSDLPVGSNNSAFITVSGSNYKDGYHGRLAKEVDQAFNDCLDICPYQLTQHQAEYLRGFGIPFAPDAARVHPHPEFKALENHILFRDIPSRLREDVLFISSKDFKVDKCLSLAGVKKSSSGYDFSNSDVNSFYLSNPKVTVADDFRYQQGSLLPHPKVFSPTMIVVHDALHYRTQEEVSYLYSIYPSLQQILFSAIIPVELMELTDSLYPHIYTLSYVDDLRFSPDFPIPTVDRSGCTSFTFHFSSNLAEGYEQPISCRSWLTTKSIPSPSLFHLGVQRLSSYGPHHLFAVSRGLVNVNREITFTAPNVVRLPQLNNRQPKLTQPYVPLKIYRQALLHADSLNNYLGVDSNAKIRTHTAQDEKAVPLQTINALVNLVRLYRLRYTPERRFLETDLQPSLLDSLFDLIHNLLKRFFSLFGSIGVRFYKWLYSHRDLVTKLSLFGQQDAWIFRYPLRDFSGSPRACSYFNVGPAPPLPPITAPGPSPIPKVDNSKKTSLELSEEILARLMENAPPQQLGPIHVEPDHATTFIFDPMTPPQPVPSLLPLASSTDASQHSTPRDSPLVIPRPLTARPTMSEPADPTPRAAKKKTRKINRSLTGPQLARLGLEEDDARSRTSSHHSHDSHSSLSLDYQHDPCGNKLCRQHNFSPKCTWVMCRGGHGLNLEESGSIHGLSAVEYFKKYPTVDPRCHTCYWMEKQNPLRRPVNFNPKDNNDSLPAPAKRPFHRTPHHDIARASRSSASRSVGTWRQAIEGDPHANFVMDRTPAVIPPPRQDAPNRSFLPPGFRFASTPAEKDNVLLLFREHIARRDSTLPNIKMDDHFEHDLPYPPNDCLLRTLSRLMNVTAEALWFTLCRHAPASSLEQAYLGKGLNTLHAHILGLAFQTAIYVHYPLGNSEYPQLVGWNPKSAGLAQSVLMVHKINHFSPGELGDSVLPTLDLSYDSTLDSSTIIKHAWGASPEDRSHHSFDWPSAFSSLPDFQWQTWTPDKLRAKAFWNAYKSQEIGIALKGFLEICRETVGEITRGLEMSTPYPIKVAVVEGLPGSGKSRPIIDIVKKNARHIYPCDFMFGFPRVFLRTDTVAKFPTLSKPQKDSFRTWEHALATDSNFAIFDEFTLFPPGFYDFYVLFKTNCSHLILLGDRLQGEWAPESEHARAQSSLLLTISNLRLFCPLSPSYRYYSYRIPHRIASCFNIQSQSSFSGDVRFSFHMPHPASFKIPVLCGSDTIKGAYVREGYAAYTYTEVQGAEWSEVVVKVSAPTLFACSLESIFTAITRATNILHIQVDQHPGFIGELTKHPIFGPLLGLAPPAYVFNMFSHKFSFPFTMPRFRLHPTHVHAWGANPVTRPAEAICAWTNSRLDQLPASFRANAPIVYEYFAQEPIENKSITNDEHLRCHLPSSCSPHNFLELEPVLPREDRELNYQGEMSSQFIEYSRQGGFPIEANFFPKQSAAHDPTLFKSAIKTRFDYATPEENKSEYHRQSWLGPLLFERWRRYLGLPEETFEFDLELFVWAIIQTTAVKLDKPIATIWNNIDRSSPEWPRNYMHAFVKSQSKAKAETGARTFRLSEEDDASVNKPFAKPGQPLVTSPDVNVFDFGPWTRYMRALLYRAMRPNIYIHGGRTINDLDKFSKAFSNSGPASTCDFTQYDMSCKAETLSFELCVFSYFELDLQFPDLVDLYFSIKTTMFTQLGTSAIMRFTGEFGTYDFNTWYNIAYMAFRYELDDTAPLLGAAFSGDDSIMFFKIVERSDWSKYSRHFALVGKLYIGASKDFCGWWLLPCGAVRNPILLALKILYHKARGSLDRCLDSYFLEALFAYNIGDSLYDHLPPLALEAQSWIINFCFQHSSIVPHLSLISGQSSYDLTALSTLPYSILKQLMPRTSFLSFLKPLL
jgi:hypothetical protein